MPDLSDEFLAAWGASAASYLTFDQMRGALSSERRAAAYWEDIAALRKAAGVVMPYRLYTPEAARMTGPAGADGGRGPGSLAAGAGDRGPGGLAAGAGDRGPGSLAAGVSAGLGVEVFVYLSKELIRLNARILRLAAPDARLSRRLGRWRASRAIFGALLENELVGALRRDGVALDAQRARRVLLGHLAPESPGERLLSRAFDLFRDPARLMRDRFTRGSLELLGEALADGIAGLDGLGRASRLDGQEGYARIDADDVLAAVCRLMNRDDEDVLPLVAIHDAPGLVWDQAPLPRLNFTAALLVRRICCERFGYPALACTGYVGDYMRWTGGQAGAAGAAGSEPEAGPPPFESTQSARISGVGYDATYYQIAVAQLDLLGLRRLDAAVGRLEESRAGLGRALGQDARLNDRQRALLAEMFEGRWEGFTVAEYAERRGVSYTTARLDLASLLDRGLLGRSFSGGSGRYGPGPVYDDLVADALRAAAR